MQILQFIIKYWDSILLVVLVLGFVVYLIKTGQTKVLKQIAIKLVTEAEGEYGSGTGIVKKSAVVSWLYNHLPAILKFIFTEKDLENIVETVLEVGSKRKPKHLHRKQEAGNGSNYAFGDCGRNKDGRAGEKRIVHINLWKEWINTPLALRLGGIFY